MMRTPSFTIRRHHCKRLLNVLDARDRRWPPGHPREADDTAGIRDALGMADLNGDGHLDVCVGTNASFVYVFAGDGTPTVFPPAPTKTITGYADVAFSPR